MENQTLKSMETRCSTRAYTSEKLTEDEIMTLVKAGLQAPTARNTKELLFTVVNTDNPAIVEMDAEIWKTRGVENPATNFYYHAPLLILISASPNVGFEGIDAGIAVQNIALAAESIGLGNVIIGMNRMILNGERASYYKEKLQIPEEYTYQISIAVGHQEKGKEPHDYSLEEQVKFI